MPLQSYLRLMMLLKSLVEGKALEFKETVKFHVTEIAA